MAMSPTQRTLAALRKEGYIAAVAERWNHHVKIRQDLFGFIDVVALGDNILAVQCTSTGVSTRITKIKSECRDAASAWLKAGGTIQVWGWRKVKVKPGGKAMRWKQRIVEITMDDLKE